MAQQMKLVTIFGGSGFVGRYVARRMALAGWRVRVAVRRPNEALFVRTYGAVGQVEPILANIRDDASTAAVIAGADAVINCVGILVQSGPQKFDPVHAEGAGRIARLSAEAGVSRLVHISAIGADAGAESLYSQSKAEGEAQVLSHFPEAVILRPSIVFGTEDQFFNRFAQIAKLSPVIPLVGAGTRFQPVHVDDVAAAAEVAATGAAAAGVYELGGPDVETFADLIDRMLVSVRRTRIKLPLPFFAGAIQGAIFDAVQALTLGLFTNTILTRDQVRSLKVDNVVAEGAKGLSDLGITPTAMEAVLDDYLYAHRPYGQYTALAESSRQLQGE